MDIIYRYAMRYAEKFAISLLKLDGKDTKGCQHTYDVSGASLSICNYKKWPELNKRVGK